MQREDDQRASEQPMLPDSDKPSQEKKEYVAPRLIVHGTIETITSALLPGGVSDAEPFGFEEPPPIS